MDEVRTFLSILEAAAYPGPRFPSLNILTWGIALAAHAACTSFGGLFVVRFILGICEGSITAGFMIVSSMFYTRREQTLRVGYWCECILPVFAGYRT
jgi:MFS transporter, ACS family, allantoate permease